MYRTGSDDVETLVRRGQKVTGIIEHDVHPRIAQGTVVDFLEITLCHMSDPGLEFDDGDLLDLGIDREARHGGARTQADDQD